MNSVQLKLAFRNALKHKRYYLLNLGGLTLGLLCASVLFSLIIYEIDYDTFSPTSKNVVRVASRITLETGSTEWARTSALLGPSLDDEYEEIDSYTRIRMLPETSVEFNDDAVIQGKIILADSGFFTVFQLPFLYGNKEVLSEPGSIVLTESLAIKFFGSVEKAINRSLRIADEKLDLSVKGIIPDWPGNSHIQVSAIIPWNAAKATEEWDFLNCYTYLLFPNKYDVMDFEPKLKQFVEEYINDVAESYNVKYDFILQPLQDIHLSSQMFQEISPNGNRIYILIYSFIAVFFLVLSGINYVNMAIASSMQRAREIGVRKVLGAENSQIRNQFLLEATLTTLIAAVLAIGLFFVLLPSVNQVAGIKISPAFIASPLILVEYLALVLLVGLLAGVYPAIYLSSFNPVQVLRGSTVQGSGGLTVRRILITIQLAISIVMIIATTVAYKQIEFVRRTDLGLNTDNTLLIRIPNTFSALSKTETLRTSLLGNTLIEGATSTNFIPAHSEQKDFYRVKILGSDKQKMYTELYVDSDFISTLKIKLKEGRNFDSNNKADLTSVIINETAAREFGWDAPLTNTIIGPLGTNGEIERESKVIGVVKDFYIGSFHQRMEPMIINLSDVSYLNKFLYLKVNPASKQAAIEFVKSKYADVYDSPFQYEFLEDIYDNVYRDDHRLNFFLVIGAGIILFISCLGIFNLSAFMAMKRSKEMGIRIVFGAMPLNVIGLHLRSFVPLSIIASILSWPIAYIMMNNWLQGFTHKTETQIATYILASILVFVVVMLTVCLHAVRSSKVNPISVIKVN
jgi:putative ABC transport system permease protein